MPIVNAFTCSGAYAVLIMSRPKRVEANHHKENRDIIF